MRYLFKIEGLRTLRNWSYLLMSIGFPTIIFLIFSSIGNTSSSKENQIQITQMLMSMTAFSLSSFALFNFPFNIIDDNNNGWNNILLRLSVPKITVLIVKISLTTILEIIAICILFLTGRFVKNVDLTLIQWVITGGLMLLGSILFLSIGTVLSHFKDIQSASILSNICYFALALLGGLWFPLTMFPKWLQSIGKLTPTYHLRELSVGYINTNYIPWVSLIILFIYGLFFIFVSLYISKKKVVEFR